MLDGEKLKALRKRKMFGKPNGLTQEELAEKIGVKKLMIHYYEQVNDKGFPVVAPSLFNVEKIAEVLNVPITELLSPNPEGYRPTKGFQKLTA